MKYFTFETSSPKPLLKTFLLSLLFLISLKSFSQSLESDRLALIDLYNATRGYSWNNRSGWSVPGTPGDNPCSWSGISCENGRVTSIAMSGNNLVGKIPESITTMSSLKYLYLASNGLSGFIPTNIGDLTNLRHLEMSSNTELIGEIPTSIANLHLLELLSINSTRIGGNIPASLGALTQLKTIGLGSNQLFGPIPKELGNLPQLSGLFLDRNQLSGDIPNELGNATSLASINLGNNNLTGTIPTSIGNLANLAYLYLESNNLSGPLPDLGGISTSCEINISFNHFTFDGMEPNISKLDYYNPQKEFPLTNDGGLLRANVGGSAANNIYRWYKNGILVATNNVTDLFAALGDGTYRAEVTNSVASPLTLVSEDYIVGPDNLESDRQALLAFYLETKGSGWSARSGWNYPGNVGDSPCGWFGVGCSGGRVTALQLNANNLNGKITSDLRNLRQLRSLRVNDNSLLIGELPSSLGELSQLEMLELQGNNLSGVIPPSFENLAKLKMLFLGSNHIGGALPKELGNMHALEILALSQNEFVGSVPEEIGNLSNLWALNLYDNLVTGQIPTQIENLPQLRWFDLSVNQLTGEIPIGIGNLPELQIFNLNVNRISGSLPTSLTNATKLEILSAGYNKLTGTLPTDIGNLTNLRVLAMADNKLEGVLPSSLGKLSKLENVFLDHNNFSGSFPEILENWNKVSSLRADHNQFDGVPLLTNIPGSTEINFSDNYLTFDALEPNISKIDMYIPQGKMPIHASGNLLYVNAGGTIANNTYYWYKDDVLVATLTDTTAYTMTGPGKYRVDVTNNVVQYLRLVSEDFIQNNSLPVQLVNFTAKKSGEVNLLRWSTTAEINNSGFEIERSGDAKKFEKIGFLDGKGESKNLETYQFVDEKPLPVSYYRLKQIDFDGKSTNSRIVQVNSDVQALKLYPNPTKDILTIESSGKGKSIEIYNLKGTKILERPVINVQSVSTTSWPIGTYIIRHGDKSEKVVVEK